MLTSERSCVPPQTVFYFTPINNRTELSAKNYHVVILLFGAHTAKTWAYQSKQHTKVTRDVGRAQPHHGQRRGSRRIRAEHASCGWELGLVTASIGVEQH